MGDRVLEIVEYAYAKLNLGLKIFGRRGDGFHDILSVFQTVDLCDRLVFRRAEQGQIILSCDDADLPVGPENLVYQAVSAFRSYTGMDRGVEVAIEKRIPMAAGLGGGSSDAAAVLRVLNRVWEAGSFRWRTARDRRDFGVRCAVFRAAKGHGSCFGSGGAFAVCALVCGCGLCADLSGVSGAYGLGFCKL